MLACAVVGFGVAKFVIIPEYTAQTELLVNQKQSNNNQQQSTQQADVQMINTYKDFIVSRAVLSRASQQLSMQNISSKNQQIKHLQRSITITSKQNSQIFTLAVRTDSPRQSAAIANTVARVFKKQVKRVMHVNNVTIISQAVEPTEASFPNVKLFVLAGALLGLFISLIQVVILARE
jgi:capsular polysaccharide biosynthesis protein